MFSIFPKDDREQTLRIKRFLMALAAYFIWFFISTVTFLLGLTRVPLYVLVGCFLGILVCNISIYAMIRTGFNKRFNDPSLTLLQMMIATFWIMVVLYYSDSARSGVLLLYLVVFVFGLFRLNVREFLFLSLFAIAAYSTVIFLIYKNYPKSINAKMDILNLVILATVLPWFSLVGGYITKLRTRLGNALSTHKKTEEKLRNEEQRFRALAEQSSDIIVLVNRELAITYENQALTKTLGYKPEEIISSNIFEYIHPDDLKLVTDILNERFDDINAPITKVEIRIRHRDGRWRIFEAMGSNLVRDNVVEAAIVNLHDITERKKAEEKLHQTLDSLRKAVGTTIQVLVSALEVRDPYTAGHQAQSANLACAIATEMELDNNTIEGIRMAGIIHDIGKLAVPAEILSKPTKLTNIEFSLIKEHSRSGYEMLKDVESPWPLAQIIYQHHERLDGTGYPRNLKGDEIFIEARILAVADVVEAMASHRPYRPSLGIEAALEEIEKNKGILYDESVVNACLRLFREKGFSLHNMKNTSPDNFRS